MGLPWSCNGVVIAVLLLCIVYNIRIQVTADDESNYDDCKTKVEDCRKQHTQLAYNGLPLKVYSPKQLKQHCSTTQYGECLKGIDTQTCYKLDALNIEGQIEAENYVCSEDGLKQYQKGNKYTDNPWEYLAKWYMKDENQMCQEKFLYETEDFFKEYVIFMNQIRSMDGIPDTEQKAELENKAAKEMNHYCNYMYVYQECIESAATRHCNETIGDWQYDMVKAYYTPHFEYVGCHIGKGMKPITIGAILIVSVILGMIFALALFCGVYEKCIERCNSCKKKKSDHDDIQVLAETMDDNSRANVMLPGENGMPQRTNSRVRFDESNKNYYP